MRIILTLILLTITVNAQSTARWKPNTQVRIFLTRNHFTPAEQGDLQRALDAWAGHLPSGISLTMAGETDGVTCFGCVLVQRGTVAGSHLGEIKMSIIGQFAESAIITLGEKAGTGKLLQSVMAHELGHSLGLDDCHCNSLMGIFPQVSALGLFPTGRYKPRHLGPTPRDIALVASIYASSTQPGEVAAEVAGQPVSPEREALIWQKEAETAEALKQYAFKREVTIQTLDAAGSVTGEYRRISRMVLGDDGRRLERVLGKQDTLDWLKITKADREDFSGAQMGLLSESGAYRLVEHGSSLLAIPDLSLAQGRVFRGSLQVDEQSRITELQGVTLPEGDERFPHFTSRRAQVGKWLFPSETYAEDTLRFPDRDVRVRWVVRFTEYRKFKSSVSITEAEGAQ